jgi:hypothetical protein
MIGIRTSGADKQYPFQVEVSNANTIVCHVGRVYDSLSGGVYGVSSQNSWPAGQNKITQRGLQKAQAYNKTELEYFPKSVKTNSAKIYYKGSSSLAGRGKATTSNATNEVGMHGYVSWPRTGPQHEYIILHYIRDTDNPDTNKWCISAVEESDISESDIVIAYIANGEIVRQIWRSDVCAPDGGGDGGGGTGGDTTQPHPFQIVKDEGFDTFHVSEGTVNNSPVGYPSTGLNNVTVWLQTYPTVAIVITNETLATDENQAWLRIGRISHIPNGTGYTTRIYQYIRNSLWLERFKCGDEDAQYWYSQI